MKKISQAHFVLFISCFLFVLMQVVVSNVAMPWPPIVTLIIGQAVIFVPGLIYCAVKKIPVRSAVRMKKTKPVNFLLALAVLIFSYPVVAILNMFSMLFVENAVDNTINVLLSQSGFLLTYMTVAVMPAFGEEFLFRGVLYHSYSKQIPLLGAFVSSLLFGLMHGNFNQIPYALFLGIVFVLMIEATDTIWIPMVMHLLLNSVSVITLYITGPQLTAGVSAAGTIRDLFSQLASDLGPKAVLISFCLYGLIALFFAAAVFALIFLTFYVNKRSMKQCFSRRVRDKKHPLLDGWLAGFLILALLRIIFWQ